MEAKLSKEIGTAVKLECPTMIDGHAHYCSAVVAEEGKDDIVFPVRVTSRGDELHYATKRWVTAAHMEKLGTHALKEKLDIPVEKINYLNPEVLSLFTTDTGKILPRRVSGVSAKLHRKITREIKRARAVNLLK